MKIKGTKARLIILAIVAAGLLGWAGYTKLTQNKTATREQPADSRPSDPNIGKQTEEMPSKTDTTAKPDSSTPAANEAAATSALSVVISRAGQIGEELQVRGIVQGAKAGTCTARLTGPGNVTQASHAVEFQQTGYTCGSINIPVSQFSVGGEWQLSLTVTAGGQTSKPATQAVTIAK